MGSPSMTNTPSASPDCPADAPGPVAQKPRPRRRRLLWVILAAALTAAFYHGLAYTLSAWTHESTDDAFLDAHVVAVAPRVAGQVLRVHVQENQVVKRSDPVVELDPGDYEVRLAQKRDAVGSAGANLTSAQAGVTLVKARFETAKAIERQELANADAARAKSQRAQADLRRNGTLRQTGVVSQEEYDRVMAEAESTAADLRAAERKADATTSQIAEARAQIGVAETMLEGAAARAKQARTDQAAAELDVSYTRILAPCDGRVTRKAVEPGAYVQVGQSLMALVPSDLWVTANFKETQLTHLRPGQPARIRIDACPGRTWRGHVHSFMAGSGARFSLLPPENAVGNFVKVVQRVPVKILFDDPLDAALSVGPGMSVVPEVRTSDFALSPALLGLAALVLGVLGTLGLGRVIDHLRD
jgi:membrane fusion protein, multidrug efflux system